MYEIPTKRSNKKYSIQMFKLDLFSNILKLHVML